MQKPRAFTLASLAGVGLVLSWFVLSPLSWARAQTPANPEMTVYKTSTCGCCSKWVDHMRAAGFTVTTHDVTNLPTIKSQHGVPAEAGSCHTALVGGYAVEGHVPADAVKRLLRERPAVAGIAVPGMPAGSPGMELPNGRKEPYAVMTFTKDGTLAVFERR